MDCPFIRLAWRTIRANYRPYFRVMPECWDGRPIDISYPGAWVMQDGLPHYIDAVIIVTLLCAVSIVPPTRQLSLPIR